MLANARRWFLVFAPVLLAAAVSGQQPSGQPQQPSLLLEPGGAITLDVVVTPKSGPAVTGLQQQDFALQDNKAVQPILSFKAVDGRQAPAEVILVVDAVNAGQQSVAYEREQIDKFLRADGGHLAYPTSLAIFTDTGTKVQEGFSTDGNALSTALEQFTVGLRFITRSSGFYGADERFQLSLNALHELAVREAARPGRKIILWVSPGWPLLSGPNIELSSKQQERLFEDIVSISNVLRQGRITLYSIDPLGTADAASARTFYWKSFLKGISKASQVQPGNLGLEVIATQTGGVALSSSNDVAQLLEKCIADAGAYYELTFDPPVGDQKHAYHQIEVRVDKPGLTARTRTGYYSQP